MSATMENGSTFVAPEGVYSVTEEHKAPTILAHSPSSVPIYPTRLSTITIRFSGTKQGPPGLAQLLGGNKECKKEKLAGAREDGVSLSSSDTPEDSFVDQSTAQTADVSHTSTTLQEHRSIFSHTATAIGGKKKPLSRPKHNIRTTSSTFITRLQNAEGSNKNLQSKQGDATFLFYNTGKTFLWVEVGSKSKEPLSRITFSAHPTCHDINTTTASSERLDIIIGFNTGDLIWFDPISNRYGRLNKQGCISSAACTSVRWVPSSSTLFIVSHADGTMVVYDKEREDGAFTPHTPNTFVPSLSDPPAEQPQTSDAEWNPLANIFVTTPPWHPVSGTGLTPIKGEKDKAKNPVTHWRVSLRRIVDFVFSPDNKPQHIAAISEDGCLRVIDAQAEQLVDCYASYFGSLTCAAWSPDSRFILTGGQDDLVTIFSPWEQRVVARCQGHSSFVSSVAFDDVRCDGRTYRFGSVGEDNKLILWDFSSGALHRPKVHTLHPRMSISSTISLAHRRSNMHLSRPNDTEPSSPLHRYHVAPSRNEVSIVQPVLVKHVECDILTAVAFLPRALLTASKNGHVRSWIRPLAMKSRHLKHGRGISIMDIQDIVA